MEGVLMEFQSNFETFLYSKLYSNDFNEELGLGFLDLPHVVALELSSHQSLSEDTFNEIVTRNFNLKRNALKCTRDIEIFTIESWISAFCNGFLAKNKAMFAPILAEDKKTSAPILVEEKDMSATIFVEEKDIMSATILAEEIDIMSAPAPILTEDKKMSAPSPIIPERTDEIKPIALAHVSVLLFPIDLDLSAYLSTSARVEERASSSSEIAKKAWKIIKKTFKTVDKLRSDLKSCCRRYDVYELFKDFKKFNEMLESSIKSCKSTITDSQVKQTMNFIIQAYESYFNARQKDLSEISHKSHKAKEAIFYFLGKIKDNWKEAIESIDDIIEEEEQKGWEILKSYQIHVAKFGWDEIIIKLLGLRGLFAGPNPDDIFVYEVVSPIINQIVDACIKNNVQQVTFEPEKFIASVYRSFSEIFQNVDVYSERKYLVEHFITKLFNLFYEIRKDFESAKVKEVPISVNFISVCNKMPREMKKLQLFHWDEFVAQFFNDKIMEFSRSLAVLARPHQTPEDFNTLILLKISSLEITDEFCGIFVDFVLNYFETEFFSKLPKKTFSNEEFRLSAEILENPVEFLKNASGDSSKINALIKFYSKFIEENFGTLESDKIKGIFVENIENALK